MNHKISIIKSLLYSLHHLSSSMFFKGNITNFRKLLKINRYPPCLINRHINEYRNMSDPAKVFNEDKIAKFDKFRYILDMSVNHIDNVISCNGVKVACYPLNSVSSLFFTT